MDATRSPGPPGPVKPGRAAAIGERYLIASYHYYPHKNFDGTLKLFERMKREGLVDWLDVTGNGAADVKRMVARMIRQLRWQQQHHFAELHCRFDDLTHALTYSRARAVEQFAFTRLAR